MCCNVMYYRLKKTSNTERKRKLSVFNIISSDEKKPQESNTDNTNSVQNLPLPKEILVSRGGACAFDSDEDSDSTSSTVVMVACVYLFTLIN